MPDEEELRRLRRENERLVHERRLVDEQWRKDDADWKRKTDENWRQLKEEFQKNRAESSDLRKKVDDLRSTLYGVGKDSPGMVVEFDRLKQSDRAKTWWIRALIAGAIAGFGTWVAEIFSGKKP